MHLAVFLFVLLTCIAGFYAKPAAVFVNPVIYGGSDAQPGDIPWQLSLQRTNGISWSHSCGATILSPSGGLTAAHCVDGTLPMNLRIVAGLIRQSDMTGTQTSGVASYTMHPNYGGGTFANDIAIVSFAVQLVLGGSIDAAQLPPDTANDYAGTTCIVSGWGRTEESAIPPDNLQKADAPVISNAECTALGSNPGQGGICFYEPVNGVAPCQDSGSPLSCPDVVGTVVAGFSSWSTSSGGIADCDPSAPSVYLRTSSYLQWIIDNTPPAA